MSTTALGSVPSAVAAEGLLVLFLQMFDLIIIPSFILSLESYPTPLVICLLAHSPAAPAIAGFGEVQRVGR